MLVPKGGESTALMSATVRCLTVLVLAGMPWAYTWLGLGALKTACCGEEESGEGFAFAALLWAMPAICTPVFFSFRNATQSQSAGASGPNDGLCPY